MTLRVITMFGKNITWYNKKNFFIITCYNVYVSSMDFKAKAALRGITMSEIVVMVITDIFRAHSCLPYAFTVCYNR